MEGNPARILVVEDEEKIRQAVCAYLNHQGYEVYSSSDGKDAIKQFDEIHPDLVILDLMLPSLSGEEVCTYIRQKSKVPVVMLTAKISETEVLEGFQLGADDYVLKPFSPRELMARVQSILKRCKYANEALCTKMSWNQDDLIIDFTKYTVFKKGNKVSLTPKEYSILSFLASNPGRVYTRDQLIQQVSGYDYDGFDRTIDSHIKNLRSKIEDDTSSPIYIVTIRGIGYRFGV